MANKVLALNLNGELTYCSAPEDMRGKGRCNHIDHQLSTETVNDFIKRIESKQTDLLGDSVNNVVDLRKKPKVERPTKNSASFNIVEIYFCTLWRCT